MRLQLNAIRDNDVPRANHGVQVLYEYAVEAGQMDRSCYFGWSSDLYHFDHFMVGGLNIACSRSHCIDIIGKLLAHGWRLFLGRIELR